MVYSTRVCWPLACSGLDVCYVVLLGQYIYIIGYVFMKKKNCQQILQWWVRKDGNATVVCRTYSINPFQKLKWFGRNYYIPEMFQRFRHPT
jgi:hypothetical protein